MSHLPAFHHFQYSSQAKERSDKERDELRTKAERLRDKASHLSSRLDETSSELRSSRAYIDQLYSELMEQKSGRIAASATVEPGRRAAAADEEERSRLEDGLRLRIPELEGEAAERTSRDEEARRRRQEGGMPRIARGMCQHNLRL